MSWSSVVGHDWAIEVLSAALTHDRVGHAYLFTGPAQIGKTTLARTFAQALNCTESQRPCGRCRSCKLIAAGRHPDVSHIEPTVSARGKATIKIETMRTLQRALNLAAYEGQYKVAIISEFDAANTNAANAFLKTLEEPPANTVLILTATDGDMLLDTIRSRCRVVSMRPVSAEIIQSHLQQTHAVPSDNAHTLAHIANGRIGWAVDAAQNASILEDRGTRLELLQSVLAQSLVERFKQADTLSRKPEHLRELLNIWLTWWRDLLLIANGFLQTQIINIDQQALLAQAAELWEEDEIGASLDATQQTILQLNQNVNIRLALENLLLTYPTAIQTVAQTH